MNNQINEYNQIDYNQCSMNNNYGSQYNNGVYNN